MKKSMYFAMALAAGVALTGCAGSNFVRPAEGELTVGKSTEADMTQKMGNPLQTGELTKNGQRMKVAKYAYAAAGGESAYPGVTPARSLSFTIFGGKLSSQEFVSSFKADSSDFDDKKVPTIVKGKTTKEDVAALLGRPTGEAVYPVIKGADDRAYIYSYVQAKGSAFNMKFFSKSLIVSFNNSGLVTDVEYTTSGEQ